MSIEVIEILDDELGTTTTAATAKPSEPNTEVQKLDPREFYLPRGTDFSILGKALLNFGNPLPEEEIQNMKSLFRDWRAKQASLLEESRPLSPSQNPPPNILEELKAFAKERAFQLMDDHDSICAVCSEGGLLYLCEECPAAYHLKCLDGDFAPEDAKELPFICPDCCEDQFIDDDDDTENNVDFVKSQFKGVKEARLSIKNSIFAPSTFDVNPVTTALKTIVLEKDPNFELISDELEKSNNFTSVKLSKAEDLLCSEYEQKQQSLETKLRASKKVALSTSSSEGNTNLGQVL